MASQYSNKGLYTKYNKAHKERDALDFYSTPTEEVTNFLKQLDYQMFEGATILEPCAGQGHMAKGIYDYLNQEKRLSGVKLLCTEFANRENKFKDCFDILTGNSYDFLSDDYDVGEDVDWIIMNPPYTSIEPFIIRALEIAKAGVIVLSRMQLLEGESRYNNIFKDNPPNDIYTYVDRIACYKNGDTSVKANSVQAYSWLVWNRLTSPRTDKTSIHHWLRRADKS